MDCKKVGAFIAVVSTGGMHLYLTIFRNKTLIIEKETVIGGGSFLFREVIKKSLSSLCSGRNQNQGM